MEREKYVWERGDVYVGRRERYMCGGACEYTHV